MPAHAAENLKLNQHLDYTSDSQDGPLINGDHLEDGALSGKPSYAIFYGEGCFNSKRAGRGARSNSTKSTRAECSSSWLISIVRVLRRREELVKKFYKGYIPHVVVLNRDGKTAYNSSGEVEEGENLEGVREGTGAVDAPCISNYSQSRVVWRQGQLPSCARLGRARRPSLHDLTKYIRECSRPRERHELLSVAIER